MSNRVAVIHRSENHPAVRRARAEAEVGSGETVQVVAIVRRYGLGDWVYRYAHPLACWLDKQTARGPRWMRTALCGCLACSRRRQRWNAWLPDVQRWKGGWQVACTRVARGLLRGFLALVDRLF